LLAFLIDIAVLGIIAFCVWRGYKNGLIRGLFGIVSLIAALIVSNAAANAYSKEATHVIMPFASGIIDSTLSDMEENDIRYQAIAHDHDIYEPNFGTAYTVLRQIGLPESAAVNLATQLSEESSLYWTPQDFINILAEKLTDTLSFVAIFGITFLILAIVFAIIGNLIGFVFSLPGLKLVDKIAGSVFGLVKGLIIALALASVVRYFGILAPELYSNTVLLEYLTINNLISTFLGI